MSVDLIVKGINHNLPLYDPIAMGIRLAPICKGALSIGCYGEWKYDKKQNKIAYINSSNWRELSRINKESKGEIARLEIRHKYINDICKELGNDFSGVSFKDEDDRDCFMFLVKQCYDPIYILNDDCNDMSIFIYDSSVEINSISFYDWNLFHELFGDESLRPELDRFRNLVFYQARACGCRRVIYISGQGIGETIEEEIDKHPDDWEEKLRSNGEIGLSDNLKILYVNDFIAGKRILKYDDVFDCYIDDFNDFL